MAAHTIDRGPRYEEYHLPEKSGGHLAVDENWQDFLESQRLRSVEALLASAGIRSLQDFRRTRSEVLAQLDLKVVTRKKLEIAHKLSKGGVPPAHEVAGCSSAEMAVDEATVEEPWGFEYTKHFYLNIDEEKWKLETVADFVSEYLCSSSPLIIFFNADVKAASTSDELTKLVQRSVVCLHAGMPQEEKEAAVTSFREAVTSFRDVALSPEGALLCCAFSEVRRVNEMLKAWPDCAPHYPVWTVLYDVPRDLERYQCLTRL
mmetsp:Transcript_38938/g.79725  ORF Transcript_38938/g.79725 Transcript_38938/m.79725 type:complete len:261 (+) Transcript_38938:48-830(+)